MKYYRQCEFKQNSKVTTAWIEERGVKVGNRISFKDTADSFWEVTSVGETRMKEQRAQELERAYLKHRKFSDI